MSENKSKPTMRAFYNQGYGDPRVVLKLKDIPKPLPKEDEMLIKIHATSANAADWHVIRADPFPVRLAFGLFKPSIPVFGVDVAGVVEAVGSKVSQFKVGDEVFGDLSAHRFGAFAEYAVAKETQVYFKPNNLTFEESAAMGCAADTALQAVKKAGNVQSGQRVLVIGASGGVGHFMVQIAKAQGAHVTAVCSTNNVDMVKQVLKADEVIDYKTTDYLTLKDQPFDVILDAAATKSMWQMASLLKPKGKYVNVGGETLLHTLLWSSIVSAWTGKSLGLFLVRPGQQDFIELKDLTESGKVKPFIERVFPFEQIPDAIALLETKRARGKVVITVVPK